MISRNCLPHIAAAGMELSWITGIALTAIYFSGAPASLFYYSLVSFVAVFIITAAMKVKQRKTFLKFAVYFFVYILLILQALRLSGLRLFPFFNSVWWQQTAPGQHSLSDWIIWAITFTLISISFISAYYTARKGQTYYRLAARFDLGILIFITLFITLSALSGPVYLLLLLSALFFAISLPALFMVRYIEAAKRGAVITGKGKIAVIYFTTTIIVGGITATLLLYPFLTITAERGYSLMEQAGKIALYFFSSAVLFFHNFGKNIRSDNSVVSDTLLYQGPSGYMPQPDRELSFLEHLFVWGSLVLIALIIFTATGLLVRFLYIKLMKEDPDITGQEDSHGLLLMLIFHFFNVLAFLKNFLSLVRLKVRGNPQTDKYKAGRAFYRLLTWGRRSGFKRKETETAEEYVRALAIYFPGKQADFNLVLQIFQEEIYGEKLPNNEKLKKGEKAIRKLYSPLNWPARLRIRITERR